MKYRKKPVVIEAIQFWNGDGKNTIRECKKFCNGCATFCDNNHTLIISTNGGNMIANNGDWIIKGVKGEFYPCKTDVFEKTFMIRLTQNEPFRNTE